MFYYDGNNEGFEARLEQYIASNQKALDKSDYEIGKGWPSYKLEDLEKATGLDGREYGFDPMRMEKELAEGSGIAAAMPKVESASIALETEEIIGQTETFEAECFESGIIEEDILSQADYLNSPYSVADMFGGDMEYVKSLAGEISRQIQPFVDQALNEFAYEGSPIMRAEPDKEFLELLVKLAMEKAAVYIQELGEIMEEEQGIRWNRYGLSHALFEAALQKELFGVRRQKYRQILGWQFL